MPSVLPHLPGRGGRGGLRLPWLTLASGAGLVLLYGLFGPAPERMIFDRDAIAAGQLWRLVTGHLVHSDPAHLIWNLAALGVLGALYELRRDRSATGTFGPLLAGAVAVDLWLWWLEPGLTRYCGLSGALNALFAALCVALWRETRNPLALLLLLGDLAKIALEATQGAALLPTSSWASVPGAHLAGLAAGTALQIWRQFLSNPPSAVLEWGLLRANVAPVPWHKIFWSRRCPSRKTSGARSRRCAVRAARPAASRCRRWRRFSTRPCPRSTTVSCGWSTTWATTRRSSRRRGSPTARAPSRSATTPG